MFVNFDVRAEDIRLWWVSKLEPEWSYRYITTGLAVRVRFARDDTKKKTECTWEVCGRNVEYERNKTNWSRFQHYAQ